MKAVHASAQTGISGLVFEDAPDPAPMFCEVVVKVAACGVTHNELDWPVWTCRAGHPRLVIIPGQEVSGTVDHAHAAAVPRAGLTAWQGLFDHGT